MSGYFGYQIRALLLQVDAALSVLPIMRRYAAGLDTLPTIGEDTQTVASVLDNSRSRLDLPSLRLVWRSLGVCYGRVAVLLTLAPLSLTTRPSWLSCAPLRCPATRRIYPTLYQYTRDKHS